MTEEKSESVGEDREGSEARTGASAANRIAHDPVSRPAHYCASDVEPITAIEAWGLGFCLGNTVKYISRHAVKGNPLEDLKKARWYLDREITRMEAIK